MLLQSAQYSVLREGHMDEQDMDVFEHDDIDLDAETTPGGRSRRGADGRGAPARLRAGGRDAARDVPMPVRVFSGAVGTLPVQTREHLRQSARESVLAVQSFVDAVSAAGLMAVDRLFADPRTPQETAQPAPHRHRARGTALADVGRPPPAPPDTAQRAPGGVREGRASPARQPGYPTWVPPPVSGWGTGWSRCPPQNEFPMLTA